MQNLQITDDVASQLYELAEHEHISATELMGQLVKTHKVELMKRKKLKEFFKPYQKNMSEFKFDREEANER
ncbi:MAG: hypothetical protein U9Q75_01300 [Pseudomonadota bacterium]|nr:hypothetical protein [Pseudomonadota bacterium]